MCSVFSGLARVIANISIEYGGRNKAWVVAVLYILGRWADVFKISVIGLIDVGIGKPFGIELKMMIATENGCSGTPKPIFFATPRAGSLVNRRVSESFAGKRATIAIGYMAQRAFMECRTGGCGWGGRTVSLSRLQPTSTSG